MASFIYLYSKFTEELLLLSAAGIFTLLSAYCYHWVIKRRRLGAARHQIPSTVVKAYLGQLINEAQFVRTQLFGIANTGGHEDLGAHFQMPSSHSSSGTSPSLSAITEAAGVPSDLSERLKALQNQLSEKESMVININVEKTKLLEEVENLRQNQKAMQSAGASAGPSDELVKKIKGLEERLEEYSLFEDDLANLKRLQQENSNLKKRIEEMASSAVTAPTPTASVAPTPKLAAVPTPDAIEPPAMEITPSREASSMSQDAIDALLEGIPAVPPVNAAPVETMAPETAAPTPSMEAAAPAGDEFEKLIDSVESSLTKGEPATPAEETISAAAVSPATETLATKSDEELLKEFENLLNS